jgi:hypothetical protein
MRTRKVASMLATALLSVGTLTAGAVVGVPGAAHADICPAT